MPKLRSTLLPGKIVPRPQAKGAPGVGHAVPVGVLVNRPAGAGLGRSRTGFEELLRWQVSTYLTLSSTQERVFTPQRTPTKAHNLETDFSMSAQLAGMGPFKIP